MVVFREMVERYIIDTAIWVDLYEDRKGFSDEPLGDFALKLLVKIKAQAQIIVLSDLLVRELEMNYSMPAINGMFKPFESITQKIIASKEQRTEAKRIAAERNVPPGDALHAILARDNGLTLVTRDRHFKLLQDIAQSYKPEDLI